MSKLNTAGDLRSFLADVLVGIKDGSVDATKAHAIAKISAQINQSIATEVTAAMKLAEMGVNVSQAGSMLIGAGPQRFADQTSPPTQVQKKIWCEQCDMMVDTHKAAACASKFCKVQVAR